MLSFAYILFCTISSFVIIFCFHKLFDFIKQKYTKTIKKNTFNTNTQKYQEIIQELLQNQNNKKQTKEQFTLFVENKSIIENDLMKYVQDFY